MVERWEDLTGDSDRDGWERLVQPERYSRDSALSGWNSRTTISGAGYASLSCLHRLPIDSIKNDRSFIAGVPDDQGSARILEAIVGLARAFSIETTAEGVETREQLMALHSAGCDSAQGYLLARPTPAAELADVLARTWGIGVV